MPRPEIEKFFHDVTRDPNLHRALLKRSRGPVDFYPQAAKLARLLGYSFTAEELRDWAEEENRQHAESAAAPSSATTKSGTPPERVPSDAPDLAPPAGKPQWSLRSLRLGEQR